MEVNSLIRMLLIEYLTDPQSGGKKGTSEQSDEFEMLLILALAGGFKAGSTGPVKSGKGYTAKNTAASCGNGGATAGSAGIGAGLDNLIKNAAAKYGVDRSLVKSVIQAESNFNSGAVSSAGAIGLMQLMPATASWLGIQNPYDPAQNIEGGVRYLKQMLDRYGGDVSLALAAYNAGPGAVDSAGGIPNYQETRDYVRKVLENRINLTV